MHDPENDVVARLRAAGCVFADDEAALLIEAAGGSTVELERMLARRVAGDPLEQILGWAEFAGLRIRVTPGVFVPRRRSELLVRCAVEELGAGGRLGTRGRLDAGAPFDAGAALDTGAPLDAGALLDAGQALGADALLDAGQALVGERARPAHRPLVLDLCCGTAAIGAAIAAICPDTEVWAADLDPAAIASARLNLAPDHVVEGDLFDALPQRLRGRFDVIVVNAPYVPTAAIATMPPEARLFEAWMALDGGGDGLDVQRRVVAGAREWLTARGSLLIETSEAQAEHTAALFEAAGLHPRIVRDEDLDATTVIGWAG